MHTVVFVIVIFYICSSLYLLSVYSCFIGCLSSGLAETLFFLVSYQQSLVQFLVHSSYSVNIWWANEWIIVSLLVEIIQNLSLLSKYKILCIKCCLIKCLPVPFLVRSTILSIQFCLDYLISSLFLRLGLLAGYIAFCTLFHVQIKVPCLLLLMPQCRYGNP